MMNEGIRQGTWRVCTAHGIVEGRREKNLYCFRGVPYARADRFMPPVEYNWEGVRKAEDFGPAAIQSASRQAGQREKYGEDCLNLNIFVPFGAAESEEEITEGESVSQDMLSAERQLLPVAVWLHGGAFQNGTSHDRDEKRVVRDHQFIYVSVEYRLGALGYLYLGEALGEKYRHTGNNGTLDQLAALKWISENIRAFGGDPDRITIFGESAGAKSLGALFLRPEMRSFCRQALMGSGAWQSIRSEETAACVTQMFLEEGKKLGYLWKTEDILTLDVDKLLTIQEHVVDNPGNTCMFGPVADGAVLPLDWQERIERGEYWQGNVMVGSCLHEMYFTSLQEDFVEKAPVIAGYLFGENARIAEADFQAYEKSCVNSGRLPSEKEKTEEWVRILSDYMYRTYSRRLAEQLSKSGSRVWYYSFEYGPASHVLDHAMAFDNAAADDSLFHGQSRMEREIMASVVYETFVHFFETGTPGRPGGVEWKPLDEEWSVLAFGEKIHLRPLTDTETLDGFPQSVFRLMMKRGEN